MYPDFLIRMIMYSCHKNIGSNCRSALLAAFSVLALGCSALPMAAPLRPEVNVFIADMVERHGFEQAELTRIFRKAQFQPVIIRAISQPVTARPWHEYRPLFVNERRTSGGVTFWNSHAATLQQARKEYGVPEEIVAAVIGVETIYGTQTGKHRVLDALVTLAFDYPRRAEFFRGELEQYLLLTREQGTDALQLRGSYAGAIGIPQFMPSSYRRYAIDFDGDGKKELLHSPTDAIGSVANYLKVFGWEAGQTAVVRAQVSGEGYQEALAAGIKPGFTLAQMKQLGVTPLETTDIPHDRLVALFVLEGKDGPEYWLGFNNFYVITRYNRSTYYAMSVLQLAEEIRAARNSGSGF